MMMTMMMTMMMIDDDDDDDDDDDVRADWRCRGCAVMIIITTVGDAEDAR